MAVDAIMTPNGFSLNRHMTRMNIHNECRTYALFRKSSNVERSRLRIFPDSMFMV